MVNWFMRWIAPEVARVRRKRRLEQAAIAAGTSRQIAKRIVAIYFASSNGGAKR